MSQPPLHPACEPLAALLGVWKGSGHGAYPTVEPFTYLEEVSFVHVGKPFLVYSQKTVNPYTNQPMHAEFGYWRPAENSTLEVILAHPTGVTEVTEGSFQEIGDAEEPADADNSATENLRIELRSVAIGLTSTAKEVTQINRVFTLANQPNSKPAKLSYTLEMAAVGQPLQFHIAAELEKQS